LQNGFRIKEKHPIRKDGVFLTAFLFAAVA